MKQFPFSFWGKYAPAAGSLLLDELGGADAAWSVARKLRTAYAGNCFRVRRSSDDTTQDIGFSINAMDVASLESFCSGTDGYIDILYDQTTSALDLVQATLANQPQIVAAGSVLTGSNSKPAAYFSSTRNDLLTVTRSLALPHTFFGLVKNRSTTNNDEIWNGGSASRSSISQKSVGPRFELNSGVALNGADANYVLGTWYVVAAHTVNGTNDGIGTNANTRVLGSAGTNAVTAYNIGNLTVCADFDLSELVVYPSDVGGDAGATPATGDDATVINNINTFYTVF